VVRSAPDGSTLLVSVNTLVMNRALYPGLSFDPVKDLAAVSQTSWGQLLLVTPAQSGYKTAGEFVAALRKQPGRLNYASPGVGTPHHLSMELFKSTAQVFLTHIPYRGTGPAVTDLLGGQVDAMFLPIHVALPHIRSGRMVALGIGSDKRHACCPICPPWPKPKLATSTWTCGTACLPPKAHRPTSSTCTTARSTCCSEDDVKKAFVSQGMDPSGSTPQAFAQLVERDAERWARLIKDQGIKAD
jgi:tripartite-type tricarboxylate transporter receptor subunit TctC